MRFWLTMILCAVLLCGASAMVLADTPEKMNYQGVLLDSEGDPVTIPVIITFSIWDDETAGSPLWSEALPIMPDNNGVFSAILGETEPITAAVLSGPDRWLELNVEGEDLTPRMPLVSAPFSTRVNTIDGASGGAISSDISVGGDLNISGKATIGPGNTNSGMNAFVAGANNRADGDYSTISGGRYNVAEGDYSTVGGGRNNEATRDYTTVGGGYGNNAFGEYSTVGGGDNNDAEGMYSTIPGGRSNSADGDYSFAAGRDAKANFDGSFVWADPSGGDFTSSAANQFLIRASGGVGINTNNPNSPLEVAGMVHSTAGGFKFPDGSVQTVAAAGGGDIEAVYADAGLTGGATSGDAHVNVGAGDGINVLTDALEVDVTDFAGDGLGEDGSNNMRINTGTGLEISSDAVQLGSAFSGGSAYDGRFVNEMQANSVTSSMIDDETIAFADIGQNGATAGQVIEYNGSAWEANDKPCGDGFFPVPANESGWLYVTPGTPYTWNHNISTAHGVSYNPEDFFVQLLFKDTGGVYGVNNRGYGGEDYNYLSPKHRGAYFINLAGNSIEIVRSSDDGYADSIFVRIWVVR